MMAMQKCVVCRGVYPCKQVKLPSAQQYVFMCVDLVSCAINWINTADGTAYERLRTWLAQQETSDYLKSGACAECGDMVYTHEDQFTYSGGRAHLHMQCFITRLSEKVWSSTSELTNANANATPPNQHTDDTHTP